MMTDKATCDLLVSREISGLVYVGECTAEEEWLRYMQRLSQADYVLAHLDE